MTKTDFKLSDRCLILEKILLPLSEIYFHEGTTDDQRKLIETTLGAAIFYLPQGQKYWTGQISEGALDALRQDPGTTLTKEHQYPRKIAAKELLNDGYRISGKEISLLNLYEEKYGKYNLVTPSENKRVSKFQRDNVFVRIEEAYSQAGISLVTIDPGELSALRKKKR
jgi:hypothetical protein